MATILINNWDICSWHHLVRTFVWLNIVSCQYLSCLTLFPNPSSLQCNTNPRCKITLIFVRHMLRILYANALMCEVACSQSVTSPFLHSFVVSCIVMTNCAKALSIGVDEFIVSLDPTMAPIGRSLCSMVMHPSNSVIPSSPSLLTFVPCVNPPLFVLGIEPQEGLVYNGPTSNYHLPIFSMLYLWDVMSKTITFYPPKFEFYIFWAKCNSI